MTVDWNGEDFEISRTARLDRYPTIRFGFAFFANQVDFERAGLRLDSAAI